MRVGSGIEKPEDLAGKTIIGKRPALPEIGLITNALLKVYKIDPSKVKIVSTTNTGEAINAIKSDTVDAVVIPGSAGAGYLQRLMPGRQDQVSSKIPADKMKAMLAMLPKYVSATKLPANTYEGQTRRRSRSSGWRAIWSPPRGSPTTRSTSDQDAVRQHRRVPGLPRRRQGMDAEGDAGAADHSLSPGAIRYFKEKGVWTPAMDKQQAELKP